MAKRVRQQRVASRATTQANKTRHITESTAAKYQKVKSPKRNAVEIGIEAPGPERGQNMDFLPTPEVLSKLRGKFI